MSLIGHPPDLEPFAPRRAESASSESPVDATEAAFDATRIVVITSCIPAHEASSGTGSRTDLVRRHAPVHGAPSEPFAGGPLVQVRSSRSLPLERATTRRRGLRVAGRRDLRNARIEEPLVRAMRRATESSRIERDRKQLGEAGALARAGGGRCGTGYGHCGIECEPGWRTYRSPIPRSLVFVAEAVRNGAAVDGSGLNELSCSFGGRRSGSTSVGPWRALSLCETGGPTTPKHPRRGFPTCRESHSLRVVRPRCRHC
jgi:hypothetical protein